MKTIKSLCVVLCLATSAQAGKSHVQYEVCAIDAGGKLGVYEVTEKRPEAMAIARFLTGKQKRQFFVVVEEVNEKGDVK